MYENNNKAIINKLAKSSIKTNRIRNIFAIVAIILTTILFTTVFTIAVTEELCNEIEQLAGVEGVGKLYNKQIIIPATGQMELLAKDKVETEDKSILEDIIKNKETLIDMYGINNILYPLLNEYIIEGEFDGELFKTRNYAVVYKDLWDINIYDVGDKINILSDEGQKKEYTIMAIVDDLL